MPNIAISSTEGRTTTYIPIITSGEYELTLLPDRSYIFTIEPHCSSITLRTLMNDTNAPIKNIPVNYQDDIFIAGRSKLIIVASGDNINIKLSSYIMNP